MEVSGKGAAAPPADASRKGISGGAGGMELDEVKRRAREHIVALQMQVEGLRTDKERLEQELAAARAQGAGALGELAKLGPSGVSDAAAAATMAAVEAVREELEIGQREELERLAALHRAEGERVRQEHEEALAQGRAQYEDYISKIKAKASDAITQLRERVSELEAQQQHDQARGSPPTTQHTQESSSEATSARDEAAAYDHALRERVAQLEAAAAHAEEERELSLEQVQRLNEQIVRLEAERSMLIEFKDSHQQQQVRDDRSQASLMPPSISAASEEELDRVKVAQAEAEANVRQLREQLDAALAESADKDRALASAAKVEQELVGRLEQTNTQLSAVRAEVQSVKQTAAEALAAVRAEARQMVDEANRAATAASAMAAAAAATPPVAQQSTSHLSFRTASPDDQDSSRSGAADSVSATGGSTAQRDEEMARLRAENERVLSQAAELQTKLTKFKDLAKKEVGRLNADVDGLKAELARARQSAAITVSGGDVASPDLQRALAEERTQRERLTRELARAEESVARMAEERASSHLSTDAVVLQVQKQLQTSEARREALELESSRVRHEADEKRADMRRLVEELEREKKAAEAKSAQAVSSEREVQAALSKALAEIAQVKKFSGLGPTDMPSSQPTAQQKEKTAAADVRAAEEARAKSEAVAREAVEEAKRLRAAAKRETIALAGAFDHLRGGVEKVQNTASGELGLASDRCADALRACVEYVDAALSSLIQDSASSSNAGGSGTGASMRSVPTSSALGSRPFKASSSSLGIDDGGGADAGNNRANKTDIEKLQDSLALLEQRLDAMTETSRVLLPRIKQVCALAVLKEQQGDKRHPTGCFDTMMALLFSGGKSRKGERVSPFSIEPEDDTPAIDNRQLDPSPPQRTAKMGVRRQQQQPTQQPQQQRVRVDLDESQSDAPAHIQPVKFIPKPLSQASTHA